MSELQPKSLDAGGQPGLSSPPADTSSATNTQPNTKKAESGPLNLAETRALVRFVLPQLNGSTFRELFLALLVHDARLTPSWLHDCLNDLIQDGSVAVDMFGAYFARR